METVLLWVDEVGNNYLLPEIDGLDNHEVFAWLEYLTLHAFWWWPIWGKA